MARRLILLRHGQTHYNATMRMQGQLDTELSELGKKQAINAAEVLAKRKPFAIVSSDLTRAADTAAALAARCELSVSYDERLRETNLGQWQGQTHQEVDEHSPGARANWRVTPTWGPPGGETRLDVARRGRAVIDDLVAHYPDWSQSPVVAVSHGGCIAATCAALLELPVEHFPALNGVGNTSWVQLSAHPRPDNAPTGAPIPPADHASDIIWRLDIWNGSVTHSE